MAEDVQEFQPVGQSLASGYEPVGHQRSPETFVPGKSSWAGYQGHNDGYIARYDQAQFQTDHYSQGYGQIGLGYVPREQLLVDFMNSARRTALREGLSVAMDLCHQQGQFLAGFSVYCEQSEDWQMLRALVENSGGDWLYQQPDSAFQASVPVLMFSELEENAEEVMGMAMSPGMTMWDPASQMAMQTQMQSMVHISNRPYIETSLRPEDDAGYIAAGLQLFRRTADGVELLLPTELPWNPFKDDYDPLAWNVLGGKRGRGGYEHDPHATAVRCMLEVIGGVKSVPPARTVQQMCRQSVVVWYPKGKYALFMHEVTGEAAKIFDGFSELFASSKGQKRNDEFNPRNAKWVKQIEDFEWVSGAHLLERKKPVTDLLENFCLIDTFRDFLEKGLLPDAAAPPHRTARKGPGRGKNGKGQTINDSHGKSSHSQAAKGGGKPPYPGSPGKPAYPGSLGGPGYPQSLGNAGSYKGPPPPPPPPPPGYTENPGKGKAKSRGKGADGPMMMRGQSLEAQKQWLGEQLYPLLQSMSPSSVAAQKITGMLLELPIPEITILLDDSAKGRNELRFRFSEAMEVLQEDGAIF